MVFSVLLLLAVVVWSLTFCCFVFMFWMGLDVLLIIAGVSMNFNGLLICVYFCMGFNVLLSFYCVLDCFNSSLMFVCALNGS